MKRTIRSLTFIEFINSFSIWIILGSFASFSFFSKLYVHQIDFKLSILLSLGCWWVYTLDHIFDGIKVGKESTSLRHVLHFVYRKQLSYILLILFCLLAVGVVLLVPVKIKLIGFAVALLTGLHFGINHWFSFRVYRNLFFKEGMIAIVATIGFCLLPAFLGDLQQFNLNWQLDSISFLLLSASNLLLFTLFDFELDGQNKFLSSAHVFGYKRIKKLTTVILFLSVISNFINLGFYHQNIFAFVVLFFMQLMLLALLFWPKYFSLNERFRFWGDFIYLFPGFVLPFL